MYESAPREPKPKAMPMTPAIPVAALTRRPLTRWLGIGAGSLAGVVAVAAVFLTGSSSPGVDAPPPAAAAPSPPREAPAEPAVAPAPEPKPAPAPKVELTHSEVKRHLTEVTKLMRTLDGSSVPKETLGPIWRELIAARKQFEGPDPDLAHVSRRLGEIEAKARALH